VSGFPRRHLAADMGGRKSDCTRSGRPRPRYGCAPCPRRNPAILSSLSKSSITLDRRKENQYGSERESAREVRRGGASREIRGNGCCGLAPSSTGCADPITSNLYDSSETSAVPGEAVLASLGCGNPAALAKLNPGETVLDLGSRGGIDVLPSARRVGSTGKAYGLDMTDEMLALARENQRKAGIENVEFLKGEIENIPLPDNSVDVVISNCVINLSADKDRVLREAFRVLKPGGRFAVSDVVVRGDVPAAVQRRMELWVGCIAGALRGCDYTAKLAMAGFASIDIEPPVCTASRMPGSFWPEKASTPMRSRHRLKASS